MGNTHRNTTVKGPTQDQIVRYLDEQRHDAYVTPTTNGITFVYGGSGSDRELSRALQCPVLWASVYDSDVFMYKLYDRGERLDTYNSVPNYDYGMDPEAPEYDPPEAPLATPVGGNASLLCTVLGVPQAVARIHALLHAPRETALSRGHYDAFTQHWLFAEALGWLPKPCITDYRYLEREGVESALGDVFPPESIIKTPRPHTQRDR